MDTESPTLENIPDSKPVRIFLPLLNSANMYRVQGIYQKTAPPAFNLNFKPGVLPTKEIDTSRQCIISIDMGGPSLSLEARISEIAGSQQLNMVVHKLMSHEQMRDFFRVDAVTEVIGKSFKSSLRKNDKINWHLHGTTIDISGSGVLATFDENPPPDTEVILDIALPNNRSEVISVLAKPVRTIKTEDGSYDVAYRFIDISTEDRDKIIGCCLEIQRRLLRLKVQVKDI